MDIKVLKVCEDDASFLYTLMNDKSILDTLKEVPTPIGDWIDTISIWNGDPDEEDYIVFDGKIPIGWMMKFSIFVKNLPLLFPLCYILFPRVTNTHKDKNRGKKNL